MTPALAARKRITVGWSNSDSPVLRSRRFWAKVRVGDDCWEWVGARFGSGYGAINRDGHTISAHRVSYELLVGPIPDGLELDHLCRNRWCVRPDHLEPVVHVENVRRSPLGPSARTHCPQGHPYEGDNLYVKPSGRRVCVTCRRARASEYRRRKRLKKPGPRG